MKRRQEQKLGGLLLEGLRSGKPTPLLKNNLEKIKERDLKRLKKRFDNGLQNAERAPAWRTDGRSFIERKAV